MPLLKNLIHIPEPLHQGDFVLKLSEGVIHADQTLRDHVVTPQLVDAFSNAPVFIQQAARVIDPRDSWRRLSLPSRVTAAAPALSVAVLEPVVTSRTM